TVPLRPAESGARGARAPEDRGADGVGHGGLGRRGAARLERRAARAGRAGGARRALLPLVGGAARLVVAAVAQVLQVLDLVGQEVDLAPDTEERALGLGRGDRGAKLALELRAERGLLVGEVVLLLWIRLQVEETRAALRDVVVQLVLAAHERVRVEVVLE